MKQHDLDPVSLVGGLVLVIVAGLYAVDHTTGVQVRWLLAVPAGLIAVGAAILIIVVRRIRTPACIDPPADIQ
jgi:uncharacterized integral membrane protein